MPEVSLWSSWSICRQKLEHSMLTDDFRISLLINQVCEPFQKSRSSSWINQAYIVKEMIACLHNIFAIYHVHISLQSKSILLWIINDLKWCIFLFRDCMWCFTEVTTRKYTDPVPPTKVMAPYFILAQID